MPRTELPLPVIVSRITEAQYDKLYSDQFKPPTEFRFNLFTDEHGAVLKTTSHDPEGRLVAKKWKFSPEGELAWMNVQKYPTDRPFVESLSLTKGFDGKLYRSDSRWSTSDKHA